MKCSIVILNWNGAEMLRRFLPSVVRCCPADAEVVVADNGSTDSSAEMLCEYFPEIKTILFAENYGFAEGYNRALAEIDSEYCVLLNSDVEVTEHWLEPLLDYMDAHPEVAAVQPKVLAYYDKEKKQPGEPILFEHAGAAGGYMDAWGYPYCRGRVMGQLETDTHQYDTPAEIFWATGACLLTRTRIFNELGGLDKDFFAHMEEIDYCWRLQCRGYQLMCLPCSTVYHLGGGALPYESPRKTYLNFRNCLLMLYKNLPTSRLCWLLPLRLVLDYVAALQYLMKSQKANAREVLHARRDYHKMKPLMRAKRKENLSEAVVALPRTIGPTSILLHFFLLRHRTFAQIHLNE